MNNTLVCIDMQDTFVSTYNKSYVDCIKNVTKQIINAKRRRDHILMVEFDEDLREKMIYNKQGSQKYPSLQRLNRLLENYPHRHYVFKGSPDGGEEVVHALKKENILTRNIRICGVYAAHCVEETVETMATSLQSSKLSLIKNAIACYDGNKKSRKEALNRLNKFKNVQIVK